MNQGFSVVGHVRRGGVRLALGVPIAPGVLEMTGAQKNALPEMVLSLREVQVAARMLGELAAQYEAELAIEGTR